MYKQVAILVGALALGLMTMFDASTDLSAEEIMREQLLNSTIAELRVVMDEHTPSECLEGAALIINGRFNETEPLQSDYGTCMRIAVRAWRAQ